MKWVIVLGVILLFAGQASATVYFDDLIDAMAYVSQRPSDATASVAGDVNVTFDQWRYDWDSNAIVRNTCFDFPVQIADPRETYDGGEVFSFIKTLPSNRYIEGKSDSELRLLSLKIETGWIPDYGWCLEHQDQSNTIVRNAILYAATMRVQHMNSILSTYTDFDLDVRLRDQDTLAGNQLQFNGAVIR